MSDRAIPSAGTSRSAPIHAAASGRVNLIGEHTDYNEGLVLPTGIPQRTHVILWPREDRVVRAESRSAPGDPIQFMLGEERREGRWGDYVGGVTRLLASEGHRIGGFDVVVESDVPIGSGLSSSAALDVALIRAIRDAFGLTLADLEIARLSQRVANEFVGARVGIMDPMAASLAEPGVALFIDTRDLTYRRIPLPVYRLELLVIDSGVKHQHAGGGYNQRRAECEEACRQLGIVHLRDVEPDDLARVMKLPDPLGRRARHVITENLRVVRAVEAIVLGDCEALGQLFGESHRSMRDDYEVSTPEVDRLVELTTGHPGVFGARLTGGGFGGSIVAACQVGRATLVGADVVRAYRAETGREGRVLVPQEGRSDRSAGQAAPGVDNRCHNT